MAAIAIFSVPTVAFGGASILRLWFSGSDYLNNRLRQSLWRAGHAHAGVLLILSLVMLLYVDQAALPEVWRWVVRITVPASAILLPVAYFLSVLEPDVKEPTGLINLAYVGGVSLAVGMITLGVGLLRTLL
jgi:hypothetical protein